MTIALMTQSPMRMPQFAINGILFQSIDGARAIVHDTIVDVRNGWICCTYGLTHLGLKETEQELFRRLFDFCKDKTMIFITHRPAVSDLCSDIIRLG